MKEMTMSNWWEYDQLESGAPYDWAPAHRGDKPWDQEDFHLDLGCGRVKKARIGIDHAYSPGVDLLIDFETLTPPALPPVAEAGACLEQTYDMYTAEAWRRDKEAGRTEMLTVPQGFLPFPDNSIESIISHHCLEHVGDGFMKVMDEVHRILKPGGLFRLVVPAFPSHAAVADPTHKRYFLEGTWHTWTGSPGGPKYTDGFAEPYTQATFIAEDIDVSPLPMNMTGVDVEALWGPSGSREFRVAFRKHQ
jgi:SAM-dependent methyltransferase